MKEEATIELVRLDLPEEMMASKILTRVETSEDGERALILILADEDGEPISWALMPVEVLQDLLNLTSNQGEN